MRHTYFGEGGRLCCRSPIFGVPMDSGQQQETRRPASTRRLLLAAVLAAVVVLAIVGELLLLQSLHKATVAAPFTRVGGPTRVETAVDASRFWLKPPELVVITPASANQGTMFAAARCAMAHDAPLLFSSRNPKRQQLIDTTISNWQKEVPGSAVPETVWNKDDLTICLAMGHQFKAPGLSMLKVPDEPLRPPYVGAQNTLESVVVLAVARAPGDPPDVAVGLALAAHLARKYPKVKVSLIVAPRYLEADAQLENQLRTQSGLVEGGVVLGSTGIVSEDTRTLLRQVLTIADQQGPLSQLQTSLGLLATIGVGLLPLIGVASAAGAVLLVVAPALASPIIQTSQGAGAGSGEGSDVPTKNGKKRGTKMARRWIFFRQPLTPAVGVQSSAPAVSDWHRLLILLSSQDHPQYVTIWLGSGWQVAGFVKGLTKLDSQPGQDHASAGSLFRVESARVFRATDDEYMSGSSATPNRTVTVSADEIDFVGYDFQEKPTG